MLDLVGPPPSHEELLSADRLVQWRPELFTIFVSHQWLGKWHPDPDGLQLQILQKALRNVIDGSVVVQTDVVSQLRMRHRQLSERERQKVANAYIWFDWFSIPQLPSPMSELGIQSIPFYVRACQLFVALVPPLRHLVTQQDCDLASWLSRGRGAEPSEVMWGQPLAVISQHESRVPMRRCQRRWCRAEMWCQLLSDRLGAGRGLQACTSMSSRTKGRTQTCQ